MSQKRYALVYQNGIANVFDMDGDTPRRICQHAFDYCEAFCAGLAACGGAISVHHCDVLGEIVSLDWLDGPGEVFRHAKNPPRRQTIRVF